MPVIIRRPRARDDIVEIWSYIADDSEAQPDAFADRLDVKTVGEAVLDDK